MGALASRFGSLFSSTKAVTTAFLLFTFISADRPARANPDDVTEPGALIERVVRRGVETLLAIQTTPKAACLLHAGESDAQHRLRLDADDAGIVRVHARPGGESKLVQLNLDCQGENGRLTRYPVEVRAGATARQLPNALQPEAQVPGTLRPALEGGDSLTLSNQELLKRGYPPRPDPAIDPGLYAHWLKIVSRPFTAVNPRMVSRPRFTHNSPTLPLPPPIRRVPGQVFAPTLPLPPPRSKTSFDFNSGIWSGAMMTNPDVKFWQIQADWVLPAVQTVPDYIGYAAAGEWIGLDNAGNDLVQAGSDSESYSFPGLFGDWTFTNYSVWLESLPDSAYFLPNFPVSSGDEISVDIFLADENGNTTFYFGDLTPSDNSVWFMIYDLTTSQSFWGTLPKPDAFSGSSAEYIMERPFVNGSTAALADYGIAGMHDCWFADSWFGFSSLDYDGSTPNVGIRNDVTMVNSDDGNTLSSAYIYPNFDTPGGGNILFVWQNYF